MGNRFVLDLMKFDYSDCEGKEFRIEFRIENRRILFKKFLQFMKKRMKFNYNFKLGKNMEQEMF